MTPPLTLTVTLTVGPWQGRVRRWMLGDDLLSMAAFARPYGGGRWDWAAFRALYGGPAVHGTVGSEAEARAAADAALEALCSKGAS